MVHKTIRGEWMRKIAISLSKGGVGKSSSAVTIAQGLASKGARFYLLIPMTKGRMLFYWEQIHLKDWPMSLMMTAILKMQYFKYGHNLWILAGGKSLSGAKRSIGRKDYGGELTLTEALKPIDGKFDYVIIDTAPSWDTLTINTMFYVDEVLTPVSLEVLTLNSLGEFLKSIESVKAL